MITSFMPLPSFSRARTDASDGSTCTKWQGTNGSPAQHIALVGAMPVRTTPGSLGGAT